MKLYTGKVYSGSVFLGYIIKNNIADLKRNASRLCNEYNNVVDEMHVRVSEDSKIVGAIYFTRINKKSPNNEIKRGTWF